MTRPSTVAVAVAAFTAGLTAMALMPDVLATQTSPQVSPPELSWSFEGGDFTVRNLSDATFIIIGYSADGGPTHPFTAGKGELTLPSEGVERYVAYQLVTEASPDVDVAASIAERDLVFDPCIPAYCPRPPGCKIFCPPGTPSGTAVYAVEPLVP